MKPKTTPDKAGPPKRPVSRWEKEGKKTRIIIALVIVVIIAAGGIVGYGIYDNNYKPWHQSIVKVNDRVFDMDYFVKMFRVQEAAFDLRYIPYGMQFSQYTYEQQGQYVVGVIQSYEIVRQKAEELSKELGVDITKITDEDIDLGSQSYFGYDPDGEFTLDEFNKMVNDWLESKNVSRGDFEKLEIMPNILRDNLSEAIGNDEYPRDVDYEHAQVRAVLAGTEEDALEIKGNWGEDFNQIIKDYSPTRYYPDGGYWLVMVYEPEDAEEHEEEGFYIKAMLLATKDKAAELKDEIVNSGADFTTLAEENSLDSTSTSGGDMEWMNLDDIELKFGDLETIQGLDLNTVSDPISENYPDGPVEWLPDGIESAVFDEFVFVEGSETSGVSDPKRDTAYTTTGGYWLVMVYEPEDAGEQEEEGLYIKAILLDSGEEAGAVAAEFDGSNFATLAEENSLDSSSTSGGDMGWMSLDDIKAEFGEDYLDDIQNLALDTLSAPIHDEDVSKQSGYWIIEVLSKEDKSLTDDDWDTLSQEAYSDIIQQAMDESEIKNYLEDDPDKLSWALDHL